MLGLWSSPPATAPICPLAGEPPHAAGTAKKKKKKKKKVQVEQKLIKELKMVNMTVEKNKNIKVSQQPREKHFKKMR